MDVEGGRKRREAGVYDDCEHIASDVGAKHTIGGGTMAVIVRLHAGMGEQRAHSFLPSAVLSKKARKTV